MTRRPAPRRPRMTWDATDRVYRTADGRTFRAARRNGVPTCYFQVFKSTVLGYCTVPGAGTTYPGDIR